MKYFMFFVCFALIVVLLGAYADNAAGQTYSYEIEVEVENTTATPYIDKRIQIPNFPSLNLITNGYLQNDADDVYLNNGLVSATTLGANDGAWYPASVVDYPQYSTNIMSIYIGNPLITRNQSWNGVNTDWTQACDSASLDIDASTGIQVNANVTLYNTPVDREYILAKQGAYELYVDGTPALVFTVYEQGTPVAATSQNLQPNNVCLSDAATGTRCIGPTGTFTYDLGTPTVALGANVTNVQVRYYYFSNVNGITIDTYLRGVNGNFYHVDQLVQPGATGAWILYWNTISWPNGCDFTINDFLNRINGIRYVLSSADGASGISEADININYNYVPGTAHSVSIPIQENVNYDVTGEYAGGNVLLSVSGTLASAAGSFGNINMNNDYLIVGEFTGAVNDCIINTGTPAYNTEVINIDFEPENINCITLSGTITDTSVNNNDVYFSMFDDGLNVTFLGMLSTGETTELLAGAGVPSVAPVLNIDNQSSEEREEGQNNPIYDFILPFSQTTEALGTPVDITMFWWMFYIGMIGFTVVIIGRYIPDLRPIAFGTIFVTYIFWLWGPVPFYMLILNILIALYALGRESQRGAI